jgi:hypothetical protein
MFLAFPCHSQIEKLRHFHFDFYRYFSSAQAQPPTKFIVTIPLIRSIVSQRVRRRALIYVIFASRPQ